MSTSRREALAGWGFVSFACVLVGVFLVVAIGYVVYLSFTEYSGFGPPDFVGFENYSAIFRDPIARRALFNTLIITAVTVPVVVVCAIAVALLLNHEFPGIKIIRGVYFLPSVVSVVVSAAVFRTLFEFPDGAVNTVLDVLSLHPIGWYTDSRYALSAVIILEAWRSVAFFALIFLAGVQDTPQELLDAARVDGAGSWARIRHVTLPHLRPAILFSVVLGTIWGFRTFAEPNVLTSGGPGDSSRTIALYAYDSAFRFQHFGYASAVAVLLLMVIAVVSVVQLRLRDDS